MLEAREGGYRGFGIGFGEGVGEALGLGEGLGAGPLGDGDGLALGDAVGLGFTTITLTWGFRSRHALHAAM